jgi:hypothetical protein
MALRALLKRLTDVPYPANFPWEPFKIFKVGKRQYATDFDCEKYRKLGKTYYVSTTGATANDGLSWATATKLSTALQKSDVDTIVIAPGLYDKNMGFATISPTRNVSIIGIGNVILSNHDSALTWTATAGQTNVWQANRSATANVFDASQIDTNGDYAKLTAQTSIANVNANAGSYYFDSASNIVYVKTSDQRQPDSNIRVYVTAESNVVSGNVTAYIENIRFHGGMNPFKCFSLGGFSPTVIMKSCKFKYGSQGGNGCFANLGAISYLLDCEAAKGEQDGFNYHINGGLKSKFAEIDCIGRDNGLQDDNDNGSTAHDGSTGIRVNGQYFRNKGPNVIDINDGAFTLCVGTEAYDSLAANAINKANFSTYGETTTRTNFYLFDCYSHGSSTYDLKMDTYAHVFLKSCAFEINNYYTLSTNILDTY